MEHRRLGKTGHDVGVVGFGSWALGGDWGPVDDEASMAALHAALDAGTDFFDTADVYGDGRSERLIARLRRERPEPFVVATKVGRRAPEQDVRHYTRDNLRRWVERSRENLETQRLDLVQLHCPPTDVYYRPDLFAVLDELVEEGAIAHYGVSVERVEEALKAIEYPGVATVQIIFNVFRQRPADRFLAEVAARDVGVIVRVPLASGLLTGKLRRDTRFAPDDHRNFNRQGQAFDVGETFAGVPYEEGLAAVDEIRPLVPEGATMAQLALRWVLMHPEVTTVIPGAKNPEQARANAAAADLESLPGATMARLRAIYAARIARLVHQRW
jgi:aryl-alcohol dehydrogenase-like predicted oxidoreductase